MCIAAAGPWERAGPGNEHMPQHKNGAEQFVAFVNKLKRGSSLHALTRSNTALNRGSGKTLTIFWRDIKWSLSLEAGTVQRPNTVQSGWFSVWSTIRAGRFGVSRFRL